MFINALMLIGLSAAILPLVLHLLSRARFTMVDWGAMMFLEGGEVLQRRSSRLHQWVLMVIRSGLIALLALALARPVIRGSFAAPARGQRTIAVVLLDCSASMGYEENGHSRMVLARGAAKQLLGLHKGDQAALLLMGREQAPADRAPTGDLWDIARRIDAASPGFGSADIARGLTDALKAVESHEPADATDKPFVRFYIVTDRQASSWKDVTPRFAADWRKKLAQMGISERLFVVPVGDAGADNVAVESVELVNGPAVVGQPADIEVKLKNYGSVQWASLPLAVSAIGADRPRLLNTRVNLLPGAALTLRAQATFTQPGAHVISAEINHQITGAVRAGGFTEDDRRDAVIQAIEPIKVLVISGAERIAANLPAGTPEGMRGEADYLQLALTPFKSAKQKTGDLSAVDVAGADGWSGPTILLSPRGRNAPEARLSAYQVIVLANIERFTQSQVASLEQFVYDGGGLLIAPGNLSRPSEYNDALYRGGSGILPAVMREPTGADEMGPTSLSGFDSSHPIFRFLHGKPDAFLSAVVRRYFPVGEHAASVRELARYLTGDPFLLESRAGHGRVLMMTTSLDADWTTLPLSGFYLPFVQSMVRYLADSSIAKTNLSPGEPIEAPFNEPISGRTIRVTMPDGQEKRAQLLRSGDAAMARFTETEQPGLYTLRVTEPGRKASVLHYVVHVPAGESDLTSLSADKWHWLAAEMGAEKLDLAEQPLALSAAASSGSRELWLWALSGVLILAVLEMALARRWSREPA